MNSIKAIREKLGLTQSAMAEGMGCTQGNVGHYERGQTVPPDAARKLIAFSEIKGLKLTFDDIYANGSLAATPDLVNASTATQPPPDPRQADLEAEPVEGMQLVDRRVKKGA